MVGLINCTSECNLACSYCFEGNGQRKQKPHVKDINKAFIEHMPLLVDYIDQLYELNDEQKTKIIFHGGEPTLIKPENISQLIEIEKSKNHEIDWEMQTNGTLLNEKYQDMIKKYDIGVGISLDGLKEHHDRYRVTKAGQGTFDLIVKHIDQLRSLHVRTGVLITITDNNVNDLRSIYDFLAKKGLSFSFNALYPTENKRASLDAETFAYEICDLFDYWIADTSSQIMIINFEQIIEGLLKPEMGIPSCNWQKDCSESFFAMDVDGNAFPCEHWVNNFDFCYGNIKDHSLEELHKGHSFFADRIKFLQEHECGNCSAFQLCYGGCPWNANMLNGTVMSQDQSICVGKRIIVKHIYDVIKKNVKKKGIPDWNFE